jgi:uncharacterized membrane protein YhaH (DUF805 family)
MALTDTPARSRFGAFIDLMFGYDGRIGRLYCFLGFLAFVAILAFLSGIAEDATMGTGDIGRYVALFFIIGVGLWMHSAVTVKRLHDRDKSGWWYLVYGAAPFGFFLAAIYLWTVRALEAASVLFVLSFIGLIWAIVELGMLRGTVGPNRFGPDPTQ